ncbi:MAG: hypothetical protein KJ052_12765 [Candidatus Hydrogenedentes bacterium]|nr:hypothetical protein [Candidatus Hydrogenedentota bacterium]
MSDEQRARFRRWRYTYLIWPAIFLQLVLLERLLGDVLIVWGPFFWHVYVVERRLHLADVDQWLYLALTGTLLSALGLVLAVSAIFA